MSRSILDTNVLVRFLVGDNKAQKAQAETWFKEAELGKRAIVVTPLVIAEACFVIESFYRRKRVDIAQALEVFLSQRWLQINERGILLRLWPWYVSGFHFVDSFLLSWARTHGSNILTFDEKIKKLL
jgi:predicted nucleic acid-binding protein